MKFFIDTANLDEIKEADNIGILDDVTTNSTMLVKQEGEGNLRTIVKEGGRDVSRNRKSDAHNCDDLLHNTRICVCRVICRYHCLQSDKPEFERNNLSSHVSKLVLVSRRYSHRFASWVKAVFIVQTKVMRVRLGRATVCDLHVFHPLVCEAYDGHRVHLLSYDCRGSPR